MNFKIKSEGFLSIIWPFQIIWEVNKPSKLKVSLNEKKIEIETTKMNGEIEKEVYKSSDKFPMTKFLKPLFSLLSLNFDDLFQYYNINKVKKDEYKLTPKNDSNLPFKHLFIFFRKNNILNAFKVIEKSGDELDILFGNPNFKKR